MNRPGQPSGRPLQPAAAAARGASASATAPHDPAVHAQRSALVEAQEAPAPPFGGGLLRALCLALAAPFSDAQWQADEANDGLPEARSGRFHRPDEVLPCGLTRYQVRRLETRELTPEDHDLLLGLDRSPAKKTDVLRADELDGALASVAAGRRATCSICLEAVEPWQRAARIRKCTCHDARFHRKCLSKWLTDGRGTCPLCNVRVGA